MTEKYGDIDTEKEIFKFLSVHEGESASMEQVIRTILTEHGGSLSPTDLVAEVKKRVEAAQLAWSHMLFSAVVSSKFFLDSDLIVHLNTP
ncbi:MAG: hypothetical protein ABI758_04210 [Candidatus Woesebacteria bacterium]